MVSGRPPVCIRAQSKLKYRSSGRQDLYKNLMSYALSLSN